MTKRLIFSLLVILITATACEDNDGSGSNSSCPAVPFPTIRLTEDNLYEAEVPTVTTTQIYSYKRGRLAGFTTARSHSVQNEPVKMEDTTSVTYEERQAIVTDNFGNVSTYFLNDRGYTIQCTRQKASVTRTYNFSYSTSPEGKPCLKNITEGMNGKVYTSIDVDYSNPQVLRIVQRADTCTQTYTATAPAGNDVISRSEAPCLSFADLCPLSLHSTVLHGRLSGEPFDTSIEQIIPDGDTTSQEVRKYTYSLDKQNIITSYKEVINSYGMDHIRIVNYAIG